MTDGLTHLIDNTHPLPAARPLGDFATERIGDELILFDGSTMQYHTLNGVAEQIWRACDGTSSIETIATNTGLPVETVETTIGELGEASLLTTSAEKWSVSMTRRRAAKLIAAGAVGLPVVLSITAPHSASAQTGECASDNTSCDSSQVGVELPNCDTTSPWTVTCCWTSGPPGAGGPYWRAAAVGYCVASAGNGILAPVDTSDEIIVSDASFTDEQRLYLEGENGNVDLEAIRAASGAPIPGGQISNAVSADEGVSSEPVKGTSGDTGNTVDDIEPEID